MIATGIACFLGGLIVGSGVTAYVCAAIKAEQIDAIGKVLLEAVGKCATLRKRIAELEHGR